MRKKQLFIIAALALTCLSGCHKDKPVETQAPLETIAPDKPSETISDKLDDPTSSYVIEPIDPETLPADVFTDGKEDITEGQDGNTTDGTGETARASDGTTESTSESESLTETQSETESETISESEAQALIDERLAEQEAAQESAADWVEQNQALQEEMDSYYEKQFESQMADPEIQRQLEELNPYK